MWTLAQKYKYWPSPEKLAEVILQRLKKYEPYIYHVNLHRTTVYIHFRGLPNGLNHKLRVSTHDERERYGYKWQLRVDGVANVSNKKRWSRYYDTIDALVRAFEQYYDNVERSEEDQKRVDFDKLRRKMHGLDWIDKDTKIDDLLTERVVAGLRGQEVAEGELDTRAAEEPVR